MKTAFLIVVTACVTATAFVSSAVGQASDTHKLLTTEEITWSPGPDSLPSGAQIVVLYGDPSKEGLFVMRAKVPAGYRIPPHTHPKPEVVTIISGAARLGMGETVDASSAKALPAGAFFALPPESPHYFLAEEETVFQLNSIGPWSLKYINPKDDPRQKTQ